MQQLANGLSINQSSFILPFYVFSNCLHPGVPEAHQSKGAAFSCGAPYYALLMTMPFTDTTNDSSFMGCVRSEQ